jgi:hypothetical protein
MYIFLNKNFVHDYVAIEAPPLQPFCRANSTPSSFEKIEDLLSLLEALSELAATSAELPTVIAPHPQTIHAGGSSEVSGPASPIGEAAMCAEEKKKDGMIYVKNARGEIFPFRYRSLDTVFNLTLVIEQQTGISREDQVLIFAGKLLEGYRTLLYYDIQEQSTLYLTQHEAPLVVTFPAVDLGAGSASCVVQDDALFQFRSGDICMVDDNAALSLCTVDSIDSETETANVTMSGDLSLEIPLDKLQPISEFKLTVKVSHPDQQNKFLVIVECKLSDIYRSILSLKQIIEYETGVSVEDQMLFEDCCGSELDNHDSLRFHGIMKDSILTVVIIRPSCVQVQLLPSCDWLTVEYKPTDTILSLKLLIEDKTGILHADQFLEYDNHLSLKRCGIDDRSRLQLLSRVSPSGRPGLPRVYPFFITVDIRSRGKKYQICMKPSDSILRLKQEIESKIKTGLAAGERFMLDGTFLDEDFALFYYNIQEDSILQLDFFMCIFVRSFDNAELNIKKVSFVCKPWDSILYLKYLIHSETALPLGQIQLTKTGSDLEDSRTLLYYDIEHGSTLTMHLLDSPTPSIYPLSITVQSRHGQTLKLSMKPTDSILSLKHKIENEIESSPCSQQRLLLGNRSLDDHRALFFYNIQEEATVHLEVCPPPDVPFLITLELLTGRTYTFKCRVSDRILTLRNQIEDDTGIPCADQRLFFDGKRLDNDHRTLLSYNIQKACWLRLKHSEVPFKIFVRFTSGVNAGKKKEFRVRSSDSILVVKQKIEEIEGIPPVLQRLIFDGRLPEDDCTLSFYNISHGSTLNLVVVRTFSYVFLVTFLHFFDYV